MRTITKSEPAEYIAWRASRSGPPGAAGHTYGNIPGPVKLALRRALFHEQGGLDAYTGERLTLDEDGTGRTDTEGRVIGRGDRDSFHIEHMYPQDHCSPAEAVDYTNMAGCQPGRGQPDPTYGAKFKDRKPWPSRPERPHFLRPTTSGCEARFTYTRDGLMGPVAGDPAAARTITELNLGGDTKGSKALADNRVAAYKSATGNGAMRVSEARRLLARIEQEEREGSTLREFCFVQKFALQRHIRTVEARRAGQRRRS